MFYDCFSDKMYDECDWIAVAALECALAPILEEQVRRYRDAEDPLFVHRLCYKLGRLGFPPRELESTVSEEWILGYLTEQEPCMRHWFSKVKTKRLRRADDDKPGGIPHRRKDVLMSCLSSSSGFRGALQADWWIAQWPVSKK